jgi:hypothetical protein
MASGPWGTDTGGWEGFEEICRIAQAESVDVLILVRPTLTHAHKRRPVVIADGPLSR